MDRHEAIETNAGSRYGVKSVQPSKQGSGIDDAAPLNWELIVGDFLEYLNRDHNWILNNLDIWQLPALSFAHAVSGMGGVRFSGIKTARAFWEIPLLEETAGKKKATTEDEINSLLGMFGGDSKN